MSYRLACAVLLSYTIWHFKMPHYSAYRVDSVWLCLGMSYRSSQNVILGDTVWHFLRKSYRPLNVVWLSLVKSYLPLPHLLHHRYTHTRIHRLPLLCARVFQVLDLKTCWLHISSLKSLLDTILAPKSSRIAAQFYTESNRVDRVARVLTDSNDFDRVLTGSVILWLWITCIERFVVVWFRLISNPNSWSSNY